MNPDEHFLDTSYEYGAPVEKVFDAWTKADLVKKWFVCVEDPATEVEIDLRVGGKYRIHWAKTPRGPKTVVGTYQKIQRPNHLAFTWSWEGPASYETLVEMEFKQTGGKTKVALKHTRFPNGEERDQHAFGWGCCFDSSSKVLG